MSKNKAYQNRLEELFSSTEPVQPEAPKVARSTATPRDMEVAYTDLANMMDQELTKVVEIGRTLSRVRDLDILLKLAAEAIMSEFGLYHIQLYLADPAYKTLLLRAAAGAAGEQLIQRNHQVPVGSRSLAGIAFTTEQPVAVLDALASDIYAPDDLLPGTRAVLVLPLAASQHAFGALEVHFANTAELTPNRQTILEILAGRLAAAIENIQLARGVDATLVETEMEPPAQNYARAGWDDYLDAITRREHIGYSYNGEGVETVSELGNPLEIGVESETLISSSINVSGESIGLLQVQREPISEDELNWSREEVGMLNTIAERIAQHIENLRLLAQAERYRAEAEDAARRLTREGWQEFMEEQDTSIKGFLYDQDLVQPISEAASEPAVTDFLHAAKEIKVRDEMIGALAVSDTSTDDTLATSILNAVAERLSTQSESLRGLDETERSRQQLDKRAAELETVARVSTAAATILSPNELLQSVVDLTKYSFNLYHAHVYLLNPNKDTLVLRAGAGKVGYRMVGDNETLPLSRSETAIVQTAQSRQGVIINDLSARPDFTPHPLLPDALSEMAVPLVVGEQLLGVFDVLASVTDRFREEDMLTFTTLASQVAVALRNAELYAEQMASVVRLRELDHLKNSFLANMSHELRTPLNSVLGFTQVILEGLDGPLTDDMTNDLGLIEKNGRHLLNLINEILDMAKIEAGRMNLSPEPVNLGDLLHDVVETSASLTRDRSL